MDRLTFISQLSELDEDDVQELPTQNKKYLDQIMRALSNGERLPPFAKYKIGSYGDDIINQVMKYTYQDLPEVISLLQICCFCYMKVHKHILKKAKETLDEQTQDMMDGKLAVQQPRIKLFKLLVAFAECGIDNEFRIIRTAFVYFMRQLDNMNHKLEMMQELTLDAIQKLSLVEFFDANCQIADALLDLHKQGVLKQLTEEEIARFSISFVVPSYIPLELQHLAKWHECLTYVYSHFSNLSKQFRERQLQASREREPTKKNAILYVVKFGGQLMPVIYRFLDSCYFDKQLDFFSVLSPHEELELGNKYYPNLYYKISVGKLNYQKRDSKDYNMLWSSFSSKAELYFDIQDDVFHNIEKEFTVHDSSIASDAQLFEVSHRQFVNYRKSIEFLSRMKDEQGRSKLKFRFCELFARAKTEQDVEILVLHFVQQEMYTQEQQDSEGTDYLDFVFSKLVYNLSSASVNPRFLAYLVVFLYYNNINTYYHISPTCTYSDFAAADKVLFYQGVINRALKDEASIYLITMISQFLEYRIISTIQYGKLICGLANKFKRVKDLAAYDSLSAALTALAQILDISGVFFVLVDADGFQQIYDNYFEKTVKNLKMFYEYDRSEKAEYLYRRFDELGNYLLETLDTVNQNVESVDERILKEQQLAYDLYFKKLKIKKQRKYDRAEQSAVRQKTEKQQKFEDLDTALFNYTTKSDICRDNYEKECVKVLSTYDEAVTASYQEAKNADERNISKKVYFVKHADDLLRSILNCTTLSSYSNLVFLYYFMFNDRIELRELKGILVNKIKGMQFDIKTALTRLALYNIIEDLTNPEVIADDLFRFGFALVKVAKPGNKIEELTGFRAMPIYNSAAKVAQLFYILVSLTKSERIKKLGYFAIASLGDETLEQDFIEQHGNTSLDGLDLSHFEAKTEVVARQHATYEPDFLKELEEIDC